ncbi:MAG: hypothetical protein M3R57_06005 [Chloroflexota bacterium]|nr:hypothetical protein [Chloroflexota bacterium]
MRRVIAALLAASWIAAACSTFAVERYARNEDIRGPWRPEPLSVDPKTVAAAEAACDDARTRFGADVAGDRLAAFDARGSGLITMIFSGAGSAFMQCELRMDAGGDLSMTGGWAEKAEGPDLLLAPDRLTIVHAGGLLSGVDLASNVVGRVGPAITSVRLVFGAGPIVQASIGGGWFTAWWPNPDMGFVVEAYDVTGKKIAEVER